MEGSQVQGRATERTVLGTDRTTAWSGLSDGAEKAVLDRKFDAVI